MRLVVATANPGKLREYRALLDGLGLVLVALPASVSPPPETGDTFLANARIKAHHAARHTGLFALGDDSGLEVTALGGWPGVSSARFAGEGATDAQRMAQVLDRLRPHRDRSAAMRTALVLAGPDGSESWAEGVLRGTVAFAPRGSRGFGYDPLFVPEGFTGTLAELGPEVKDRISHRARAAAALRPAIERLRRP